MQNPSEPTFYSKSLLSSKGPLSAIWVAAFCFNKLKKPRITNTDIPSSVDEILVAEVKGLAYRVLAYLVFGLARIFSKKVEYLFNDCDKVLLKITDFAASNKKRALVKTLDITIPERFELDAFNLEILDDTIGGNVLPYEDITLQDSACKTRSILPYSRDMYCLHEDDADQYICSGVLNEEFLSSFLLDFHTAGGTSCNLISLAESNFDKSLEYRSIQHEPMELEMFPAVGEEPGAQEVVAKSPNLNSLVASVEMFQEIGSNPHGSVELERCTTVQSFDEDHHNEGEDRGAPDVGDSDELHAEVSMQGHWDDSVFQEVGLNPQIIGLVVEKQAIVYSAKSFDEHHETDGIKVPEKIHSDHVIPDVIKEHSNASKYEVEKLLENVVHLEESMDVEMTQTEKDVPEAITEDCDVSNCASIKLLVNMFGQEESRDVEMIQTENDVPAAIGEDCNVSHCATIEKLQKNMVGQEKSRAVEMIQTENDVPMAIGEDCYVSDCAIIEKPRENMIGQEESRDVEIIQTDNDVPETIREDCNVSDCASIEKLRENTVGQEESRDVEMIRMVEDCSEENRLIDGNHKRNTDHLMLFEVDERPDDAVPVGEEHQSTRKQKIPSELTSPGNSMYNHRPLSVTIATTPRSKSCKGSGIATPEMFVISTPAVKEGARVPKKRKRVIDSMVAFPIDVLRENIRDARDLKRTKVSHAALAARRRREVIRFPQCFLDPLIPCISTELRSVLCGKKLKSFQSLVVVPQVTSICSPVDGLVETIQPLEKLDASNLCSDGLKLDSLEKLDVSPFPNVCRLDEIVERPELLDMMESPTAGRSLEQVAIAPVTPNLRAKSLRSFESPERPDISSFDRERLESEMVEKELSPGKEHEVDVNMMNEEIFSCEEEIQNQYGWSERTRAAVKCLHKVFLNQKKKREEEVVNLAQLLEGRTKKDGARLFYETLVLKSKEYIDVKQENAYGGILVSKGLKWGQAEACIEE